jgi:thiamine-monophosphate kinase
MSVEQLPEIRELLSWLGNPPRSPAQTHGVNESDSEIISLGNGTYLAATVDLVSEELALGLYQDPYTMGWVAATASLSDLAAVGASPLGMLLAAGWTSRFTQEQKARVASGFSDALRAAGTYLLGGDSGRGEAPVLGGVGLGLCLGKPLSRMGILPGDILAITGVSGCGPALGTRVLLGDTDASFPESAYRPQARLTQGQSLREIAHAAMDTSDGILGTLEVLSALNGVGFALEWSVASLDPRAVSYFHDRGLPLWLLWASEHGDYQLILSISPDRWDEARLIVPGLIRLGTATAARETTLSIPDGAPALVDFAVLRTLNHAAGMDAAVSELKRRIREGGLPL